jgi:hypothetical protein
MDCNICNTGLAPGTYDVQIRDTNHPTCVFDLGNQILTYPLFFLHRLIKPSQRVMEQMMV